MDSMFEGHLAHVAHRTLLVFNYCAPALL
uniref:Uncharacterized protein n=1 Tax=Arundo donax TaxID=35708 RepID=A0A0A9CHT7_ARUDO